MNTATIAGFPFAVDEQPYCLWGIDVQETNLRFLDGIDPDYYRHVAEMYAPALDGEQRKNAAIAIRLAYSQGLETLFALLAAAVQAPQCPVGWLLKYQPRHLRSVVRKLKSGQRLRARLKQPISWLSLSKEVHRFELADTARSDRLKQLFARAWQRFAYDFLDDEGTQEYNSIKHGFRARSGGFKLSIGLEETPGVPAPPERMSVPEGSEFGTSFPVAEHFGSDRVNFQLAQVSRNWSPDNLLAGLLVLSICIKNVLAFLKIVGGRAGADVKYHYPTEEEIFDMPWEVRMSFMRIKMNALLSATEIDPATGAAVLATYEPLDL